MFMSGGVGGGVLCCGVVCGGVCGGVLSDEQHCLHYAIRVRYMTGVLYSY